MKFVRVEELEELGFQGFHAIERLRQTRCLEVPELPGVYTVVRRTPDPPRFLSPSPGGHFKGKDPTVPIARLQQNWVEGTVVVYFGKAGGPGSTADLRRRLWSYLRFGAGEPIGHWGGRLIWQLADHEALQVGWRPSPSGVPRDEERALLESFEASYGVLPFANLTR